MITRLTLFRAEAFIKRNVGTLLEQQELVKRIRAGKDADPVGVGKSNYGCWRKNFDETWPLTNVDWLYNSVNELLTSAVNFYAEEDYVYSNIPRSSELTVTSWANINQPGSRNTYHTHRGHHYVACYYLQGTETGDLVLANPANVLGDCNPEAPYTHDFSFSPKDGDLILWPAWVPHEVETNMSKRERINIAFNIRIKP